MPRRAPSSGDPFRTVALVLGALAASTGTVLGGCSAPTSPTSTEPSSTLPAPAEGAGTTSPAAPTTAEPAPAPDSPDRPPSTSPAFATLDPTFGAAGRVVVGALPRDVIVDADGGLVYVTQGGVARLTSTGAPDPTFAPALPPGTEPSRLHHLADGRWLVLSTVTSGASAIGSEWRLTRLSASGVVDPAFGSAGSVTFELSPGATSAVTAFAGDGSSAVVGWASATQSLVVVRRDASGAPMAGFGEAATATLQAGAGARPLRAAFSPDGTLVVLAAETALAQTLSVLRLTTAGAPDATFGTGGKVVLEDRPHDGDPDDGAVAVQPDGKVLVAAASQKEQIVVRLLVSGRFDAPFADDGVSYFGRKDAARARSIALAPDGRILVTGTLEDPVTAKKSMWLARLRTTGAPDSSFGKWGHAPLPAPLGGWGNVIASGSDGRIVIGGATWDASGTRADGFFRVMP